jgi:hypothetical protein
MLRVLPLLILIREARFPTRSIRARAATSACCSAVLGLGTGRMYGSPALPHIVLQENAPYPPTQLETMSSNASRCTGFARRAIYPHLTN